MRSYEKACYTKCATSGLLATERCFKQSWRASRFKERHGHGKDAQDCRDALPFSTETHNLRLTIADRLADCPDAKYSQLLKSVGNDYGMTPPELKRTYPWLRQAFNNERKLQAKGHALRAALRERVGMSPEGARPNK